MQARSEGQRLAEQRRDARTCRADLCREAKIAIAASLADKPDALEWLPYF